MIDADDAIRIGQFRQLFVDDFLIEKFDGVTRIYPPARKHPDNPLVTATLESEGWEVYV